MRDCNSQSSIVLSSLKRKEYRLPLHTLVIESYIPSSGLVETIKGRPLVNWMSISRACHRLFSTFVLVERVGGSQRRDYTEHLRDER